MIDASVAIKWVTPEPGAGDARSLRDAFAAGDLGLLAPDLYASEVTNVLWKKQHLLRELDATQAEEALALLWATLPDLVPTAPLMRQALSLATTYGHPVYDCVYVVLALREGCPLVTSDAALARQLGPSLGIVATVAQAAAMVAEMKAAREASRWKPSGERSGGERWQ